MYSVSIEIAATPSQVFTALTDPGLLKQWQPQVVQWRRPEVDCALARLPGVRVYPTLTNFVLARVKDADRVFDGLKARRILIKNLNGWHPLLANCLRMTVGKPEENDLLLAALAELDPSK